MKRVLFGLAGGIGNCIFALPALKKLSRVAEVSLWVEGDYPQAGLWRECRYVAGRVYVPGDTLPRFDEYLAAQYAPTKAPGIRFRTCGWPKGTFLYGKPEWQYVAEGAVGDGSKEDVSDWFDRIANCRRFPIYDVGLIPGGKPGDEWSRKKWGGFQRLGNELEARDYHGGSFGTVEEVAEAGLSSSIVGPYQLLENVVAHLASCRVVVANDCGIGHLASSLGIPTVMIYTATSSIKGEPVGNVFRKVTRGLPCSPCQSTPRWKECQNWVCRDVRVDDVLRETLELLESAP